VLDIGGHHATALDGFYDAVRKGLTAEEGAPADRFAVFHDESDALAFVVS
jgi:hypothetical protein